MELRGSEETYNSIIYVMGGSREMVCADREPRNQNTRVLISQLLRPPAKIPLKPVITQSTIQKNGGTRKVGPHTTTHRSSQPEHIDRMWGEVSLQTAQEPCRGSSNVIEGLE
jgi:hypothetical protein